MFMEKDGSIGETWIVVDFPLKKHNEMLAAESIGQYYYQEVKDNDQYATVRLEEKQDDEEEDGDEDEED
jgi:hypothetical protein